MSLGSPDDNAAALEVMKDAANGFYGFRAHAAEDRFLQANKRKSRRLLLFNHNFGTNEQWNLLSHHEISWTKMSCSFQHRRNEVRLTPYSISSLKQVWMIMETLKCEDRCNSA